MQKSLFILLIFIPFFAAFSAVKDGWDCLKGLRKISGVFIDQHEKVFCTLGSGLCATMNVANITQVGLRQANIPVSKINRKKFVQTVKNFEAETGIIVDNGISIDKSNRLLQFYLQENKLDQKFKVETKTIWNLPHSAPRITYEDIFGHSDPMMIGIYGQYRDGRFASSGHSIVAVGDANQRKDWAELWIVEPGAPEVFYKMHLVKKSATFHIKGGVIKETLTIEIGYPEFRKWGDFFYVTGVTRLKNVKASRKK